MILAPTSLFSVPGVTDDMCMVFDATVSGKKDSLCDPNLILPSMGIMLMTVDLEAHMVDLDVGEIFHNFRLSSVLAKYCGFDLLSYLGHKNENQGTPLWMRWVRIIMGLVFYIYTTIQGLLWSIRVVRGDRSDPDNPFRWEISY